MKIFVAGGAGFIGSNFIRYMLSRYDDVSILNFDALTYAGNLENLRGLEGEERYRFVRGDIASQEDVTSALTGEFDVVVNFAAESHVDRSIDDPAPFIRTNVLGTGILLSVAKERGVPLFVQISTDEVYGSLGPEGYFTEETPLAPNSPYSASKAGADLIARSYFKTFGYPVIITRCSNNYGPYQFPEKLIPLFITNALEDKPLPLYGDGMNVRDWIYVEDHCEAIDLVIRKGKPGEVYNIGGECEKTNLEITETILELLGKPRSLIRFVEDRPGHDRRYAMDISKIRKELGFEPKTPFREGMEKTVQWYKENEEWWRNVKSGEYLRYYQKVYGKRLGEEEGSSPRR
ncbi:MAG: dTDP-glucose 4,6-dehydratase [Deltaproteobacteria bacterium]|nr:MAG: dTDP-glucose 4,6-dehydratase [Deltaproteobacteria bacterium]